MEHLNITIVGVWDIFFSSQTNANSRSQVAWQFFLQVPQDLLLLFASLSDQSYSTLIGPAWRIVR